MEGFILAAGLGTRLRPLTDDRPKALVEINGVTLLELTLRRLEAAGVEHIVVNVHHFADKVTEFIRSRKWEATIDISDERELLLDTGGGLKKASKFFSSNDNILIHNVDILSNIDLRNVEEWHRKQRNLVTLCVSRRETKRMLAFDADGLLVDRTTTHYPLPTTHSSMAFSGISVVSPKLFALLPEADHPYPVIDEYIRLSHEGHRIDSFIHPADHWLDVGKPETLEIAKRWTLS